MHQRTRTLALDTATTSQWALGIKTDDIDQERLQAGSICRTSSTQAPIQPPPAHESSAVKMSAGGTDVEQLWDVPSEQLPPPKLVLPWAAALSAASSPVTPPVVETPHTPSPVSSNPSAAKPSVPQACVTPFDVAAAATAATPPCSNKHRLNNSLLLQQLLPLTASLAVGISLADAHRLDTCLTLLASVPVTAQLLFATQAGHALVNLMQHRTQLESNCPAQHQLLLAAVFTTAQQLLQRWKAVLAAEVAAFDQGRMHKAIQALRSKHRQQAIVAAATATPPCDQQDSPLPKPCLTLQYCSTDLQRCSSSQRKRSYGEWLLEQDRLHKLCQGVSGSPSAGPSGVQALSPHQLQQQTEGCKRFKGFAADVGAAGSGGGGGEAVIGVQPRDFLQSNGSRRKHHLHEQQHQRLQTCGEASGMADSTARAWGGMRSRFDAGEPCSRGPRHQTSSWGSRGRTPAPTHLQRVRDDPAAAAAPGTEAGTPGASFCVGCDAELGAGDVGVACDLASGGVDPGTWNCGPRFCHPGASRAVEGGVDGADADDTCLLVDQAMLQGYHHEADAFVLSPVSAV